MARVILIQQVFNSRKWMELVYPAMVNQTYKDVEIIAQIVIDDGGCKEYIQQNFPHVKILEPGYNIGFSRGHNEIFASTDCEYYQLVNPDLILEPTYVEEVVKAFESNQQLGAATGKLLKYDIAANRKLDVIDTTGVTLWRNGRAADRGQNMQDKGQYDSFPEVVAVSGAGPMYRRSALESVKMSRSANIRWQIKDGRIFSIKEQDSNSETTYEYFDEDFLSYWEDVDLSLRLQSMGWQSVYVPHALAYHGRTASSAKKDYADVSAYKAHHDALSSVVKQLNYKNHIFLTLKNIPYISWKFFAREFFMLAYLILLERPTLKIFPVFLKQLPLMWKKRKWVAKHRKTAGWVSLVKARGIVSVVDETEGVNQSKTSLRHWVKEFFRLMRLVFGKR